MADAAAVVPERNVVLEEGFQQGLSSPNAKLFGRAGSMAWKMNLKLEHEQWINWK